MEKGRIMLRASFLIKEWITLLQSADDCKRGKRLNTWLEFILTRCFVPL